MMDYKLHSWLVDFAADSKISRFACANGLKEALWLSENYGDEKYYRTISNPVNFLWGVVYRQPEVALDSVAGIVKDSVKFANVEPCVRRAIIIAIEGSKRIVLTRAFSDVSHMKHATTNACLGQIAFKLLRWRLGDMRPIAAAEGVRQSLGRHTKLVGSHIEFLPELKKRVPFDVWENGFGDAK